MRDGIPADPHQTMKQGSRQIRDNDKSLVFSDVLMSRKRRKKWDMQNANYRPPPPWILQSVDPF
jgi:hypothetical protein